MGKGLKTLSPLFSVDPKTFVYVIVVSFIILYFK
jgi:hypothetical protein